MKILLAAIVWGLAACGNLQSTDMQSHQRHAETHTTYQCPMHPEITSDKPGNCPICGMNLVPVESNAPSTIKGSDPEILYWVAPMDPAFRSDKPGKSPMGMDLVPVYATTEIADTDVPNRTAVQIATERIQMLGIRTTHVQLVDSATKSIRAVGTVQVDDERITHVHTKVSGWIEKIRVQSIGSPVQKHEVLYELYSPELIATQEELLSAIRNQNTKAIESARTRLQYWNVAPSDIRRIEQSGKVWRTVPFRSPISGYIQKHKAVEGMHASAMTDLYILMNLEKVWVIGSFYETQLEMLKTGTKADIRLPSGRRIEGTVEYVYPTVDPRTRFATVRFSFANPDMHLRPGMYVDLNYVADLGPGLVIPADAVMQTGERNVAFVHMGNGIFAPRELDMGLKSDTGYLVYDGLDEGEEVATSAAFFIDSESSLKAALKQFSNGSPTEKQDH